jgi:hypothetical protein
MKKLHALVAGFADEVFRTIRGATLEELAELLGAEPAPAVRSQQRTGPRVTTSNQRSTSWPTSRRAPERTSRQLGIFDEIHASPETTVVAEITDPERLLGLESDTSAAPNRAPAASNHVPTATNHRQLAVVPEPAPEASPPSSTEKPVSSAPVLLRANEALVRASNAGIVIRRRKGA